MTHTAEAPLADASRDDALSFYADLLDAGTDLSATELAERFGRTDRWARGIRAEVAEQRAETITQEPETMTVPVTHEPAPPVLTPNVTATIRKTPEMTPETIGGEHLPQLEPADLTSEPAGESGNLVSFAQNRPQDATATPAPPAAPDSVQFATGSDVAAPSWSVPDPETTDVTETVVAEPETALPVRDVPVPAAVPVLVPAAPVGVPAGMPGTVKPSAAPVPETPAEDASGERNGRRNKPIPVWPVLLLALPAFAAVWSGWVGLGELTGFGVVHPLPGIADSFKLNTAITLPIGVETYAAFALYVWLSGRAPVKARRFAQVSALAALGLGALGQVAYHLMVARGVQTAPWQITTAVACLPVAVLGMGAALAHLVHAVDEKQT